MKRKSPIALLALALAGAALAQSSVTLAGRMDMGLRHADTGASTVTRLDSGNYTASRLVLRGSEDLGGGLSALFAMEHRFNADTGTPQSAKFWNAGSYVGLSGKSWGTVTLGRQYTPMFWSFLFAEETGRHRLHGFSAVQSVQRSGTARIRAASSPIQSGGTLDSVSQGGVYALGMTSAFEDNMIVYKSPSFGGLTAMLAYEFDEKYEAAGNGRLWSGNVEYRSGPLYASVAANQKRGRVPLLSPASSDAKQKFSEQLVSGMYEVLPGIKLWGNVHPWQMKSVANTELKGRDWMLGASYWLPGERGQFWLNYANKSIRKCEACNSSGWGIGYHHHLSKRTELYVAHARVSNSANAANTLAGFAPDGFGRSVSATTIGLATTF